MKRNPLLPVTVNVDDIVVEARDKRQCGFTMEDNPLVHDGQYTDSDQQPQKLSQHRADRAERRRTRQHRRRKQREESDIQMIQNPTRQSQALASRRARRAARRHAGVRPAETLEENPMHFETSVGTNSTTKLGATKEIVDGGSSDCY